MFRAICAHHHEVKIVLYRIWYHHTCRWPSGVQVERVERCFVCKKQNVQHTNLFVLQNHVSFTELLRNWQPMKLKQDSELELNDSANVGSVISGGGGGASYVLVSVFVDVSSFACVLHRTPYTVCTSIYFVIAHISHSV